MNSHKNITNLFSRDIEEKTTSFLTSKDYLALNKTCKKLYGPVDLNSRNKKASQVEKVFHADFYGDDAGTAMLHAMITGPIQLPLMALMYIGYGVRDFIHYNTSAEKQSFIRDPRTIHLFKNFDPNKKSDDERNHLGFSTYIP